MERPTPKTRGLFAFYDVKEMNLYIAYLKKEYDAMKQDRDYWKLHATGR